MDINTATEESFNEDLSSKRIYFSEVEKLVLLELIQCHLEIINDKRNDNHIVQEKEKVWSDILSKFHSWPGVVQRDKKQLKQLWKNLKVKAKKDLVAEREGLNNPDTEPLEKKVRLDRVAQMVRDMILSEEADYTTEDNHNVQNGSSDLANTSSTVMIKTCQEEEDDIANTCHEDPPFPSVTQASSSPNIPLYPIPQSSTNRLPHRRSLRLQASSTRGLRRRPGRKRLHSTDNNTQDRLLELAEKEHVAKMEVFAIKKRVQLIKEKYWQTKLESLQTTDNS